jgi:RNA polymerase sigma factor (sigma-70 family)
VQQENKLRLFEATVLPHFAAAYNFARWMLRDEKDAEDVVQESYMRAYQYFSGYHGGDGRAWLLTIVRNTSYNWLQKNRSRDLMTPIDDAPEVPDTTAESDPEAHLLRQIDEEMLRQALSELPIEFREVIILREMEGLSYKEIAALADLPIGTVMSRLGRARLRLHQKLAGRLNRSSE